MRKYNHAFDFAVQIVSNKEDGEDVTAAQLRAAIIKRANEIPDEEMLEACGLFDTYEEDGEPEPFIIEVSVLGDFEDLDPEDLNEDGECAVDGAYLVMALDEEEARDIFHDKVGIANLDDYVILVREKTDADTDDTLRNAFV